LLREVRATLVDELAAGSEITRGRLTSFRTVVDPIAVGADISPGTVAVGSSWPETGAIAFSDDRG
jgi:hypothetical protein